MDRPPPPDVVRIGHDPDAFEAFYRDHLAAVQRFVARRVDDPHVVADLTTEVFLAAIDSSAGYSPARGRPTSWLAGIARNVVADHVRRRAREHAAVRRSAGRRVLDVDAIAHLEDRIDAERHLRSLYRTLAGLPERDRRLFELTALDGLSVVEAAAVLGIRPATARVRLHRARTRVRASSTSAPTDPTAHPIAQEALR